MKRILLIRTTTYQPSRSARFSFAVPPLGLMYLAAIIRKRFPSQYAIKIIDMNLDCLSVDDLRKEIKEFRPDIIGCSVLSCENDCMNELATAAKDIDGGVTFIAGGPHATMCYSDVLRNHNIDIAVLGEGEETLCELLLRLENNEPIDATAGIAFKKGGQVVITKSRLPVSNLDDIPFPAWDLIRLSDYSDLAHFPLTSLRAGKRYMALFTSRGCPYQCTYCHQIFGKVFRKRSAENVFKEIEELHTVYGVDEFFVFDDTFNFDRKRAEEISDKIISSGIKIWIAFPNGLRGDILDTALLEKLKAAGTYLITFSVESASPRIQKMIRKNLDIEKLNVMIEAADRLGMVTRGFFMLGFPGETIAEAKETIEFAARSKLCLASFFCVTFQKSTRLFEEIIKEFPEFSVDFNADDYLHPNRFYQEKITKIPLRRLLHWAHVKFYLNPGRIIKIWLRIKKKNPIYYLDYFFSYKSRFGRYQ